MGLDSRPPASFNPRPPARSDMLDASFMGCPFGVSIHAPLRGATPDAYGLHARCDVSIHAPLRGATKYSCSPTASETFQSTPPCEERLHPPIPGVEAHQVSIHAPLRGATFSPRQKPPWSARVFNPRPPARSDPRRPTGSRLRRCVSIHAPPARSDLTSAPVGVESAVSIHAPPARSDAMVSFKRPIIASFNPRPPARSD